MDDDIRKWYNVGNLFSKKIHLFSSFHLRLSKEVRRLSPPNVSVLLLRVFNRSWKYDGQLFRAENFDLRLLKWFQKSLILKTSRVETSFLTLFYACVTCHLVGLNLGLNGVEICQLFVVSESVKTAKDFMFDTLPYKVFDVNCEIAKIECFFVILLYWANTLSVKVRLRYPNRTRPS